MARQNRKQTTWIIPDDGRVVRHSELREIYEREGTLQKTASLIGSDTTTVMKQLREMGVDTSNSKAKLAQRIAELEAEVAALRNGSKPKRKNKRLVPKVRDSDKDLLDKIRRGIPVSDTGNRELINTLTRLRRNGVIRNEGTRRKPEWVFVKPEQKEES